MLRCCATWKKSGMLPSRPALSKALNPQNQEIGGFYVAQKRHPTDFEALKLWKRSVGLLPPFLCSSRNGKIFYPLWCRSAKSCLGIKLRLFFLAPQISQKEEECWCRLPPRFKFKTFYFFPTKSWKSWLKIRKYHKTHFFVVLILLWPEYSGFLKTL